MRKKVTVRRSRVQATARSKDGGGQWAAAKGTVSYRLRALEQSASTLISHDIRTQDRVRVLEKIVEQLLTR